MASHVKILEMKSEDVEVCAPQSSSLFTRKLGDALTAIGISWMEVKHFEKDHSLNLTD